MGPISTLTKLVKIQTEASRGRHAARSNFAFIAKFPPRPWGAKTRTTCAILVGMPTFFCFLRQPSRPIAPIARRGPRKRCPAPALAEKRKCVASARSDVDEPECGFAATSHNGVMPRATPVPMRRVIVMAIPRWLGQLCHTESPALDGHRAERLPPLAPQSRSPQP